LVAKSRLQIAGTGATFVRIRGWSVHWGLYSYTRNLRVETGLAAY
jgi:hypothetical protein